MYMIRRLVLQQKTKHKAATSLIEEIKGAGNKWKLLSFVTGSGNVSLETIYFRLEANIIFIWRGYGEGVKSKDPPQFV